MFRCARRMATVLGVVLGVSSASHGQTWAGLGSNGNWDNQTTFIGYRNWSPMLLPPANASIVFGSGFTSGNPNLNGNRTVASVTFNTPASFILNSPGQTLTITTGQVSRSGGPQGTHIIACNLLLQGNPTFDINGTNTLQVSGRISGANLSKLGTTALVLSGPNDYTGTTWIRQGTILLDADNTLPIGTAVKLGDAVLGNSAGTLDLAGRQQQVASIATEGTGANTITSTSPSGVLVLTDAGTNTLTAALTGQLGLNKVGTGTLTIANANTCTGPINVVLGTLAVSNTTGSATGTGILSISNGATLRGAGRIGSITSMLTGSTLTVAETGGEMNFTSGLLLSNGSAMNVDVGTNTDLLKVAGNLFQVNGTVTLNLTVNGTLAPNTAYPIIDWTNATTFAVDASNFAVSPSSLGSVRVNGKTLEFITPFAAPTGLVATVQSPTAIALDWNDHPDAMVTNYSVYRSTTFNFVPAPGDLIASNVATSAYLDGTASPATTYYYKVVAFDTQGRASYPSAQDSTTTPSTTPKIIYVNNALTTGANNGTSWADAFHEVPLPQQACTLMAMRKALDASAPGDQIWVAAGVYMPTNTVQSCGFVRNYTFQLRNGVTILGGFPNAGTPTMNDRDPVANPTYLDGDIQANPELLQDSYHVVTGNGTNRTAVLDGFTIRNGENDGSPGDRTNTGGGLIVRNGSPIIRNCTITNCAPHYKVRPFGGAAGFYVDGLSHPLFENCTVSGNFGVWTGGGGMVDSGAKSTFRNCTFSNNGAQLDGGGLGIYQGAEVVFIGCRFANNSGGSYGGGMSIYENCKVTAINTLFENNSSSQRGGGFEAVIGSEVKAYNCIFRGNSGNLYGAGVMFGDAIGTLINCTITANGGSLFGDGLSVVDTETGGPTECTVINSIITNNGPPSGEVFQQGGTLNITHSNIQGGWPGTGNFSGSPLFVNSPTDLRLQSSSICVEAGLNAALPLDEYDLDNDGNRTEPIPFDFGGVGSPRIIGARVDIGAYEVLSPNPPPDKVTNLVATAISSSQVDLDWDAATAPDFAKYVVYRSTRPDFEIAPGDMLAPAVGTNHYADTTVKNGITYYYRVTAVDTVGGESIQSDIASALPPAVPEILYVRADAAPGGNGTSWSTAFRNLYDALPLATEGDQVWVATGTYLARPVSAPNTQGLTLNPDVRVYGGFTGTPGSEGNLLARDGNPLTNNCVVTGDINGDSTGDTFDPTRLDDSEHVITITDGTSNTILDGITVSGGTVRNNDFNSPGGGGGGLLVNGGSPRISRCRFTGNTANIYGPAMYLYGTTAVVTDCVITGNSGSSSTGAISTNSNASPTLIRCEITNNSAELGGGVYMSNGGLTLVNCRLTGNHSNSDGGAITAFGSAGTGLLMINCLVSNNTTATGTGSGLYLNGNVHIINCTIAGNSGQTFSNAVHGDVGVFITNSIVAGNTPATNQVYDAGGSNAVAVTYSLVGDAASGDGTVYPGTGNTDGAARFVDASGGNYRLQPSSAAVEIGSGAALPADAWDLDGDTNLAEALPVDLDGAARIVGVAVDAGCYEQTTPNPAPAAPTFLAAFIISGTQVDLQWNANTEPDLAGYNVYRSLTPNFTPGPSNRIATGVMNPNYSDFGTIDGYMNYYKVTAIDTAGGESSPSNQVQVTPPSTPEVIYVKAGATGPVEDGQSWTTAFKTIEAAQDVSAAGDEIWVASGTYRPNRGTNLAPRYFTFQLKNSVSLIGGFSGVPGTEGNAAARNVDPLTNNCVLSGDLAGNDTGPINDPSRGENVYRVVYADPTINPTAVLDGFVITAGNAANTFAGSGMLLLQASPTIRRCLLTNNISDGFGALQVTGSSSIIDRCAFVGNVLLQDFGAGAVGADNSNLKFLGCLFANNSGYDAGAVAVYTGNAFFINCTMANNTAVSGNAAIYNDIATITVQNSVVWGNVGTTGLQLPASGITVSYSCVQDANPNDASVFPGAGNIDDDPLFVNALTGNFRLSNVSPASDAGSNSYVASELTSDLAGSPRFAENPNVPDTGTGAPPIVDMGAYEVPETAYTVTAWRSVRTHTGNLALAIPLNATASGNGASGPTSESRLGGIQRIEVDLSAPVTLANVTAVSVSGRTTVANVMGAPVTYAPTTVTLATPTTLAIQFAPGLLPDDTCYNITLGAGLFTQTITGDLDVNVRSVYGDANSTGDVSLGDAIAIKAKLTQPVANAVSYDVNISGGTINLGDAITAKSRVGSPAHRAWCP